MGCVLTIQAKILKFCAIGLLVVIFLLGMNVMGFSKILFSKVQGVVVNQGEPVADVTVTRYFNFGWSDEEGTETVKTNSDGRFEFPVISRFSIIASLLPHEPSVSQIIKIHHDDKEYIAWHFLKRNYKNNGELGKPIKLVCELTREPGVDAETKVAGICTCK